MITISSNHMSHDLQVKDAVDYMYNKAEAGEFSLTTIREFEDEFPEWQDLVWSGAWLDTAVQALDPDYMSWVCDWIEQHTDITWYEGEPVIFEDDDERVDA